jgi:hypothetical protein
MYVCGALSESLTGITLDGLSCVRVVCALCVYVVFVRCASWCAKAMVIIESGCKLTLTLISTR